ncbi:membrane-associated proteins in eicosanoid and glutathione metabolism [Dichomitus squalens]|uniref:Glutathione S-transferase 3, mitochondrial n=1 Tax=Dichomitus squalens TaxID=114155 RepID=A0A4Q9P934_9APHY|nr:membrane-associated proteins in eicosanoid and glutathione metabolism [Dichomitus squalens LYAD-421 SS1]EJF67198.1 membrane-associated proteins in eicosanoid and glutathione metabolism [Dichomitus squalens LYAD-421 SS1]TBU49321.1 membrane-associated proteins in eicosanoid and glutathione metabolism [Dichomitus squalens]TBU54888.1 membrane-associated proteins in eicosanoid and glutathione metabolism [Dichomitus squalens]
MSGIVLHKEFAYPVAAAVSTFWLLTWQTIRVGAARKLAKIDYPQVYAEKAEAAVNQAAQKFNCAQRAHQNTLEVLPVILTGTLVTGLKHPIAASALCGTWVLARVFYTIGYSTGDPKKRNMLKSSTIGGLALFGLVLTSTASAVAFVRQALEV